MKKEIIFTELQEKYLLQKNFKPGTVSTYKNLFEIINQLPEEFNNSNQEVVDIVLKGTSNFSPTTQDKYLRHLLNFYAWITQNTNTQINLQNLKEHIVNFQLKNKKDFNKTPEINTKWTIKSMKSKFEREHKNLTLDQALILGGLIYNTSPRKDFINLHMTDDNTNNFVNLKDKKIIYRKTRKTGDYLVFKIPKIIFNLLKQVVGNTVLSVNTEHFYNKNLEEATKALYGENIKTNEIRRLREVEVNLETDTDKKIKRSKENGHGLQIGDAFYNTKRQKTTETELTDNMTMLYLDDNSTKKRNRNLSIDDLFKTDKRSKN
jgi:hypothetical protein